jgi:adenosine deaminase
MTPPPAELLRTLPKVELHVHLGGTIDEATATELARRHGVDPASLPLVDGRYPRRYDGFRHFLDVYFPVNELIRTPDDIATVAAAFARRQTAEGIRYTELMHTAMIYVRNGMEPAATWSALRDGLAEAGDGAEVTLVVDAIRDHGSEEVEATVRLVEGADAPVVGLGLTGVEGSVPLAELRGLRSAADGLGLGFAAHAGEMAPPSAVRDTLRELAPDRIDHGVSSVQDPGLVEELARSGVPLDVCPSSNVALGFYPSVEEHPFVELWRAGVNVNVSTDDPPMVGSTLSGELAKVAAAVGLSLADVVELQRRAIRASFAPTLLKERVLAEIDAWAAGHAGEPA